MSAHFSTLSFIKDVEDGRAILSTIAGIASIAGGIMAICHAGFESRPS